MLQENVIDVVRAAWADALGGGRVVDDDTNFFGAGGNSMEAATMTATVSRVLGRRVRMRLLFDAPSFGAYIRALDEKPAGG